MAKVKAPLFGFEARGQLGKAIVYFPWKGIQAVRTHVIPANPNTALQDAQRTRLENAVDEWHGASYAAADVTAWNRLSQIIAGAMSGFNAMVRRYINEAILTNTWERIRWAEAWAVGANSFQARVNKSAGGNAPTVRWGTTPTALLNNATMVFEAGTTWAYTIPGLGADTLYYWTVDVGTPGTDFGRVGIYTQRTTE